MDNGKLKRQLLIDVDKEINDDKSLFEKIKLMQNLIENYKYEKDDRFYTFGRRNIVIKEFNNNILEKNINDAYGNLQDIINCDDFLPINVRDEIINKGLDYNKIQNDMNNYKNEGFICLQEKDIIMDMINKLDEQLKENIYTKEIFTPITNMDYEELKKLKMDKINLCKSKLNGNIDEIESKNEKYLLTSLKQILLNIKMIDNKILNDFSEKTSINEKEKLVVEMNILEIAETLIKNFDDVKLVIERVCIGLSNEVNKEKIERLNLPYSSNLVMIPTTKNCAYPQSTTVCNNLLIDYLLSTLAATDYDYEYFKFIYHNLNNMYKFDVILDNSEKDLVDKLINNDSKVDKNKLSWLYEECLVFAWMIGLCEFPQQERENDISILNDWLFLRADEINKRNLPSKLFDLLYDKETKTFNYNKLNFKSFSEILEKADYLKRCLWALEELRINNKENKSGLDETIIHYQLEAFKRILNWDLTNPGIYILNSKNNNIN